MYKKKTKKDRDIITDGIKQNTAKNKIIDEFCLIYDLYVLRLAVLPTQFSMFGNKSDLSI